MLNAASAALHLLIIRKGGFFLSWTRVSVLSLFYQSAPWKANGRDLPNVGRRSFCRASHLTSILDLECVFFFMELNTRRRKKRLKKVQDDETVHVRSFTQMEVHGTMMALERVLLWCLSRTFFSFFRVRGFSFFFFGRFLSCKRRLSGCRFVYIY